MAASAGLRCSRLCPLPAPHCTLEAGRGRGPAAVRGRRRGRGGGSSGSRAAERSPGGIFGCGHLPLAILLSPGTSVASSCPHFTEGETEPQKVSGYDSIARHPWTPLVILGLVGPEGVRDTSTFIYKHQMLSVSSPSLPLPALGLASFALTPLDTPSPPAPGGPLLLTHSHSS